MSRIDDASMLVRQVVRGEVSVERLSEIGVRFVRSPRFELIEPAGIRPFAAEASDVAAGMIAFCVRGGEEAQKWAQVMLGASNVIDLFALEQTSTGDQLLEALWRMSEGAPVGDQTIDLARSLLA